MRTKTEQIMHYVPTGETYTVDLYEFDELPEDVKTRIIDEYMENRAYWIDDDFRDYNEHEIWECVRDLEKSITGARVSWQYNRWYSCDFDVEYKYDDCYNPCELEHVDDTGYYASMDICDAWNAHIRKLNAFNTWMEYIEDLMSDVYPDWSYCFPYHWIEENKPFYSRLEVLRDRLIGLWYEELERACIDVANTIQSLLICEWEDVNSREYAQDEFSANEAGYECRTCEMWGKYPGRIYYNDSRKWFTIDGELYEQANVNHECVSIVKCA